jgi:3',5'-cyclic AMP phosphodiesterase CpdA
VRAERRRPARVLVVSDSHLSARTPEAVTNWDAVVDHVAVTAPDLVVHAGDVSAQGADRANDLEFAAGHLARLAVPLGVVPGNHDVGEPPGLPGRESVVDDDRVAAFRAAFGADRFACRAGRWAVVGIDVQVLGSDTAAEAEQWRWLHRVLAGDGAGPTAVVLHKPLAVPPADRPGRPARYVQPDAARRLAPLLAAAGVRVVVSGHVHQWLRHEPDGRLHLWAPTTWAVLPDGWQPAVGEKRTGALELALHDDGRVDVALIRPTGLRQQVLGDGTVADPYS